MGDLSERHYLSRVGNNHLKRFRRTSKDVLSGYIKPWTYPQPVFNVLRVPFAKGGPVDLQRGRGDWRTLSEKVYDRLKGSQGGPLPRRC